MTEYSRRRVLAVGAGTGAVFLAGCSSDIPGGDSDGDGSAAGTFRLLISDQPVAIEDFDSLDVTLSAARVYRADEDEEITPGVVNGTADNETTTDNATDDGTEDPEDDESEGVVEFDLDSVTVDLTQVKGDRAVAVLEGELEEGRYSGIELRVASTDGVVDGEAVDVKVPSNRLRIIKPFEIGADEELDFVFDINVVQKGPTGGYNLLPVIGESGVAGEDVEVEEVDPEDIDTTGADNGTDTSGEGE